MLTEKTLIDHSSFFSSYDFEKNGNIILSYFKNEQVEEYLLFLSQELLELL